MHTRHIKHHSLCIITALATVCINAWRPQDNSSSQLAMQEWHINAASCYCSSQHFCFITSAHHITHSVFMWRANEHNT